MLILRAGILGLALALTSAAPRWTAILRPVDEHGPKGSATAESGGSTTRVTIELSGAKPGGALIWQIRSGSCASLGSIWGQHSMYPVLNVNDKGAGNEEVILPLLLPSNGAFAVTVHQASGGIERLACGALLKVPMPDTTQSMLP